MPYSAKIKGISIRSLNLVMLILSLLLFALTLYTTFQIWKEYNHFISVIDEYVGWERAAHQVHLGSDHLTEQARLFTQKGQKKYADNYFYELHTAKSREQASQFLDHDQLRPEQTKSLVNALNLSNKLINQEIYAMRLVAEANGEDLSKYPAEMRDIKLGEGDRLLSPAAKREKGRMLLFDDGYMSDKNSILGTLADVINQNLSSTNKEQQSQTDKLGNLLSNQRMMLMSLCVLNILTFAMIIILIVKPLQNYLRSIRDDKTLRIMGAYEFRHLALTYNKIFALKERHDKMMKYKAEHDPLTGLLNRNAFDSLEHLLACEPGSVAFILADVDKFKEINDNYGHEIGDAALKKVADLLQHSFRADDLIIRMGGDEFAVVMHGNLADYATIIPDKINYINKMLQNPRADFPCLSLSVGIAVSENGFSETLYKQADIALYHVKEAGRCGYQFYRKYD